MPRSQYNLNHSHEQRHGQAQAEHKAREHEFRGHDATASDSWWSRLVARLRRRNVT